MKPVNDASRDPAQAEAQKRENRRKLLTVLAVLLIVAALAVLAVSVLSGSGKKDPTDPAGTTASQQTAASETPPASAAPPDTERPETSAPAGSSEPETTEPAPAPDESWKLILVNADHPLPEDYTVTLKPLRNGHQVDERIYPELQQMFDDARAAGIFPLINESYRTAERQQQIMDKYIAGYEAAGYSHDEAVKKAREIVALPGTSEHQLGLALDIIAEYDSDSTATWKWLKENCWRYGFILRYPADKEAVTGYSYEPWHFRYVGVPTAQEITEQGLCLEEYLEALGEP